MNKEQQTIKKIQELVPEILELKKGCEINAFLCENDVPIDDYPMDKFIIGRNDKINKPKDWKDVSTYIIHNQREYLIYSILGRDIFLEDVMIAVSKKQGEWSIRFWGNGVIRIAENIDWKSNKSFQDQSQECKDFIGDLILNK